MVGSRVEFLVLAQLNRRTLAGRQGSLATRYQQQPCSSYCGGQVLSRRYQVARLSGNAEILIRKIDERMSPQEEELRG